MSKTTTAPFDFAALDLTAAADTPVEIEIKHPVSGDGLGVFVSVVGAESATFQTYLRAQANAARRKAFEASRKGKQDEPTTVEQDEDDIIRAVAACMTGWRTVVDGISQPAIVWDGRSLEFSEHNACLWLKQFRWVRGQINEATADMGNFIKD